MKNKILLLFLCIGIGFSLIGCKAQIVNNTSSESENSKKVINSTNKKNTISKNKLTKKQKIWKDAKSTSVASIIKTYRWETIGFNLYTNFNDFISAFEEIYNENKFAKKLVDKSRNIPYNEWDINTQLVFDTYIRLLFAKDEEIYKYDSLGNIEEAWYAYYEPANESFYYMRFTNFPKNDVDRSTTNYVVVDQLSDGRISIDTLEDFDHLRESGTIRVLPADGSYTFINIGINDMGTNRLNELLSTYKNFIDFLIKYRNDIYSDVVKTEIDVETTVKEKIDKLSKMIPQIGMTSTEVEFTEWGYPDDINRDTYAWGTTEQWVYDGKGYVYFENGIVTSVSER